MGPRYFPVLLFSAVFSLFGQADDYRQGQIQWNSATLTLVQPGGAYARMARLSSGAILCSFELDGAVQVRRSDDDGRTWSGPVRVADYAYGLAANPEMLVLQNGDVLLSYNERPVDGIHSYTIQTALSHDEGRTWTTPTLLYEGGTNSGTGCWEPAAIQLAGGEIQLYFANEKPYPATTEQEITRIKSWDNGLSWGAPERVSFRIGHRDGMPAPALMNDAPLLAIEDDGISGTFKPAIVSGVTGARWSALEVGLPASVYAGAPSLLRFPTGEMLLSVQSGEGRRNPGTLGYSRMVVYLGDPSGHNFTNRSEPFDVPAAKNGLWNSLFLKDSSTVTAISGTTVNGVLGIWAIDGRLVYAREPRANAWVSPLFRH